VYTCYVYSGGALAKFEISIPVLNYLVQILLDFLRPKTIFPSNLSSILSTYKSLLNNLAVNSYMEKVVTTKLLCSVTK
jgi:hypothetical protein